MRVLLTTTAATDQRLDGLTLFTESLASHLSRNGHTCALFASNLHNHPTQAALTETNVNELPIFRAALPEPRSPEEALDIPGATLLFQDALARFKPDVVHFHALELLAAGMIEAAAEAGIPTAMTLHDFYLLCPAVRLLRSGGAPCPGPEDGRRCGSCLAATGHLTGRYRGPMRGLARRWDVIVRRRYARAFRARFERLKSLAGRVGAVVSPSRYLGDRMVEAGMLESYQVIPNGSDLEPLPPRPGGGAPVLGMLAHHSQAKGTLLLIRALRSTGKSALRLRVCGTGDPKYLAAARKLSHGDGRISFDGPFAPSDVANILAGLDLIVVPSIYPENCPLVVQDAMASGRPCIVPTNSGATESIVDGRHGLHFERGNAASLAETLQRLTGEPGLLATLRENLAAERPVIARADVAEQYLALYTGLLERRVATSP